MKSITIKCYFEDRLEFDVIIKSRVTILTGKSATGKTLMIECATNHRVEETRDDVFNYVYTPNEDPIQRLSALDAGKYVFIDEESVRALDEAKQLDSLLDAGYFLLLVTRRPILNLTYGINDVYELVTDGNTVSMVPYYGSFDKLPKCEKYATEDRKSGYQYWSNYLTATHMKSNRDWSAYIEDYGLIMDGAALGSQMRDIMQYNVQLYAPISFEWLVLQYYTGMSEQDLVEELTDSDKTLERLCTRLLQSSDVLRYHYTKTLLLDRIKSARLGDLPKDAINKMLRDRLEECYMLPGFDKEDCKEVLQKFLKDIGFEFCYKDVLDRLPEQLNEITWKLDIIYILHDLGIKEFQ